MISVSLCMTCIAAGFLSISAMEVCIGCIKPKVGTGLHAIVTSFIDIQKRLRLLASDFKFEIQGGKEQAGALSIMGRSDHVSRGICKSGVRGIWPMAQEQVDRPTFTKRRVVRVQVYLSCLIPRHFPSSRYLPSPFQSHIHIFTMSFDAIPILDLTRAKDPTTKPQFLDELRHALLEVGFLYLRNVGIPEELTKKVIKEGVAFFDLPMEEKYSFPPFIRPIAEWLDSK
jgi:non-haem dioxygenase in morphine synthesis N-terminal